MNSQWGGIVLSFAVFLVGVLPTAGHGQVVDTSKTRPLPPTRVDSARAPAIAVPQPAAVRRPASQVVQDRSLRAPPITPKRAFIYSLLVPGLGQSRLDRGTAGALFAAIELASWAMVRKSSTDLYQVRRFSADSVPNNYTVTTEGRIAGTGSFPNVYPVDLVSTRRLHREDWFAALAFNHLVSGADAFVAAQLWDVVPAVAVRPSPNGVALVATVRW